MTVSWKKNGFKHEILNGFTCERKTNITLVFKINFSTLMTPYCEIVKLLRVSWTNYLLTYLLLTIYTINNVMVFFILFYCKSGSKHTLTLKAKSQCIAFLTILRTQFSALTCTSHPVQCHNVSTYLIHLFMSIIEILTPPADARGLVLGPEPAHTAQKVEYFIVIVS